LWTHSKNDQRPPCENRWRSGEGADCGIRFQLMGELGKIRRRRGGREFFLDFRPYGRVWSNRGIRITDEGTARRLLEQIRGRVADESKPLDEGLAEYLPVHAKPNLVPRWLERWLDVKRSAVASKTLSPTYLCEVERYAAPGGYFSFFDVASIHEFTYGMLEDWAAWLGAVGSLVAARCVAACGARNPPSWEA
jgi:hypothetical protein